MSTTRNALLAGLALSASLASAALAQDAQAIPAAPATSAPAPEASSAAPVVAEPAPVAPAPAPAPVDGPAQPAAHSPAAPHAEAEAAQAAEVEAFMVHELAQQGARPKLEFYGFADFAYRQWMLKNGNRWKPYVSEGNHAQFIAGNLNLYMKANLAEKWSSLAEVRFHFAPVGTDLPASEAVLDPTTPDFADNTSEDPVEFGRTFDYGFIEVERVHIDFSAHPLLSIRAGRFLTPYGVWNVDHGSPVVIDVTRPYIIGEGLIPEAQTGFEVYGSQGMGKADFGYYVTLSNGRGPIEQIGDLDRNKGLGGRLWLRTNGAAELTLGASGYYGTYTDRRFIIGNLEEQKLRWAVWEKYTELGLGADLRLRYRGLEWITEALSQQRVWDDDARGLPVSGSNVTAASRAADHTRWGVYSLLGYRFGWYGLMPFALFQFYDTQVVDSFAGSDTLYSFNAGVNARVVPSVVLKLSFGAVFFRDPQKDSPAVDPLYQVTSQIAWAF